MTEALIVGSTFSGVGGMDLGLHAAGMETAFQCEIDPFRRRVLEARWPSMRRYEDVRNIGNPEFELEEQERLAGPGGVSAASGAQRSRSAGGSEPAPDSAGGRDRQGRQRADGDRHDAAHVGDEQIEPAAGRPITHVAEYRPLPAIDILVGGFPCQDLSVAGRRAGLQGERSGLFHEFIRVARLLRPQWLLVENVPGLLSSPPPDPGADFDTIRETFAELGYGLALRMLDSRFLGVPQRRRRVYIVGYLGGPTPPEVLFEPEGSSRDPAQGGAEGQGAAGDAAEGARDSGRPAVVFNIEDITGQQSGGAKVGLGVNDADATYTLAREHHHAGAIRPGQTGANGQGILEDGSTHALDGSGGEFVASALRARSSAPDTSPPGRGGEDDFNLVVAPIRTEGHTPGGDADFNLVAHPLEASDGHHGWSGARCDGADNLIAHAVPAHGSARYDPPQDTLPVDDSGMLVRRLTPLECERLQGFPDGWTCLCGGVTASNGCTCSDGPRYSALGDANTIQAIYWIGRRIVMADAALKGAD